MNGCKPLSGGGHPFGERFERDANVLKGAPNLSAIRHLPEAADLVARLLSWDPTRQGAAFAVFKGTSNGGRRFLSNSRYCTIVWQI